METYSTQLSGVSPLQRQMRGMECVLPSQSCHSPLLSSAIRSQSRVTVGPPVETDPERVNAVMRSSRPLMGDNGSTHSLSDVYYIQVHLSFRGSWPRVTPRAIKPDCGPNLTGTGRTAGPGSSCWSIRPPSPGHRSVLDPWSRDIWMLRASPARQLHSTPIDRCPKYEERDDKDDDAGPD